MTSFDLFDAPVKLDGSLEEFTAPEPSRPKGTSVVAIWLGSIRSMEFSKSGTFEESKRMKQVRSMSGVFTKHCLGYFQDDGHTFRFTDLWLIRMRKRPRNSKKYKQQI